MIEVAAFPAPVLQLRDKVTSPLGALWLQGFVEGIDTGGTGAVFVGSVVVICLLGLGLKTVFKEARL